MSERYQFQPGLEYLAKPLGMMYGEIGPNQTPCFKVAFSLETDAGPKRCDWNGWLTEKSKKRTIEIVTSLLGWNGSEETTDDGIFTDEDVLDWTRQVKVTVKYNDKGYPEVEWVNSLGGVKFAGAQKVEAKRGMQALGLKAEFLSLKKSVSVPKQTTPKKDLPF